VDGLCVDGYDWLIKHLSEKLKDSIILNTTVTKISVQKDVKNNINN